MPGVLSIEWVERTGVLRSYCRARRDVVMGVVVMGVVVMEMT
jgi:hypothetical protein